MRTIIAGSRYLNCPLSLLCEAVQASGFTVTEVVSGGAIGVDRMGEIWAGVNKIPCTQFIPEWRTQGKRAGVMRNKRMADYAEALIAIWDGKSRGTKNMIEEAGRRGLRRYIFKIENEKGDVVSAA